MANDVAYQVLARVKALRRARGLSQQAFAEAADFGGKYFQALEAGRKINFRFATFLKLAKACGVEPWELLYADAVALKVAEVQAPYGGKTSAQRPKR